MRGSVPRALKRMDIDHFNQVGAAEAGEPAPLLCIPALGAYIRSFLCLCWVALTPK